MTPPPIPEISPQARQHINHVDQLNAQLGIIGALILQQYQQQRQTNLNSEKSPNPKLNKDFASLANVLTQIQYDLFDITITLASNYLPNDLNSRIDEPAIQWLRGLVDKISTQLPPHTDPILPIGNTIATQCYLAKTLAGQILISYHTPADNPHPHHHLHQEYIQQLQTLLFVAFRWANVVTGEHDWYWKPKTKKATD